MATVVRPSQSPKLKKVLRLHKQIEDLNQEIERGGQLLRSLKSSGLGKCRRALDIQVNIRDFNKGIQNLEARLAKLPALCSECKGKQIIITGHMTDMICMICHGDGLNDGPLQRAHRSEQNKELEKLLERHPELKQKSGSFKKVPPGTIREPKT